MASGPKNPPPMADHGVPPAYETEGQDGPLPDGLYVFTNNKSRTVLDLDGGNSAGGAHCAGFSRNSKDCIDHQLWIVQHDTSSDTYTLKNLRGGTYLDLQAGRRENGSQVTGYPRFLSEGSRRNQEWCIIEETFDQYKSGKPPDSEASPGSHESRYRIQCSASKTFLEIAGGNPSNGARATCSARVNYGDHQLWTVERVSRTTREIKAILASWKPDLLNRLFQPYGDDAKYFVLPYELRKAIWEGTRLQHQSIRKHVFDYDDFVIKSKDAISTWARDRLRIDEYSVLFGVVYGNARRGPRAYNWYLSSDMHDLMFFDPQTGREYTQGAVNSFRFEPTLAIF